MIGCRAAERIGGGEPEQMEKLGPTKWIVPSENYFEILHALKCVLGASEALFRAYT